MLKVTIELLPGGDPGRRRTLGVMTIANVSDLQDVSDYDVAATEGPNPLTGEGPKICGFKVLGHRRRQSVWKLLAVATREMEGADAVDL
jgi:hypothetical protein